MMFVCYCTVAILLAVAQADSWCCDQPVDFDAKMAKLVAYNNFNNDSKIELIDIEHDFNENYDKNKDNKTSKVEWVLTRDCLFGDSVGYAEDAFGRLDRDKDGFITHHDLVLIGFSPKSLAAFEARNRVRYHDYEQKHGTIVG